jgi:pyroglutamyl-peptidase
MGGAPRILITGFGPFPGAPYNPTGPLVERLLHLRRPAFETITRIGHVFPVTYAAVDRELPDLIARHRPDALLMFGLASRTPFIRIEARARNTVTQIWPDAAHTAVRSRMIATGAASTRRFGPHTRHLLHAALATGVDARSSLNAGAYLCNYLGWRAIEATQAAGGPRLAAFIHVPLVPREASSCRRGMTLQHLVDAGEALLMETARLVRSRADLRIAPAGR